MSKEGKRQLSIMIDKDLVDRLDRWIEWQKQNRDYHTDRSHVLAILLRRFLDKNDQEIKYAELQID